MDRIVFAPLIDLPLVAITLAAFLWHFNRWAYRRDIGTTADLPSATIEWRQQKGVVDGKRKPFDSVPIAAKYWSICL